MTPSAPILTKHPSTCTSCRGRIFAGDEIARVDPDCDLLCAGDWVHAECAPTPEQCGLDAAEGQGRR